MPDFRTRPTVEGVNVALATDVRRTLGWFIDGAAAVANQVGPTHIVDLASTLVDVRAFAVTAPSGSAFDFDIKYSTNGTSWATIFSTRPTIAASSNGGGGSAVFSTTAVAANSYLRLDVIGANGAANITVSLRLRTP